MREGKPRGDRHLIFSLQGAKRKLGRQYFTFNEREELHRIFRREIEQGTIRFETVKCKLGEDVDFVKRVRKSRNIGYDALVQKVLNSIRALIRKQKFQ